MPWGIGLSGNASSVALAFDMLDVLGTAPTTLAICREGYRKTGEALPPYERSSLPLQRLADVPSYFADMLVRRAESLQLTREAKTPVAWLRGDALAALGAGVGDRVRVTQDGQSVELEVARDDRLAEGVVRVSAAHPATAALARQFGAIEVERVR